VPGAMTTGRGGATTTGAGATTTGAGMPTLILTSAAEADESNPPAVITPTRNRARTAIRPVVRMTPSMPDDRYLVVSPTNLTCSRPFQHARRDFPCAAAASTDHFACGRR